MQAQSSLGARMANVKPSYNETQIGRVVSVADYTKYGRIEVVFLNYSKPNPVWVNGDIDRKPVEGDQVLVGFIQGRPDSPYLAGFIRNECYTSNFIIVEKDRIVLQLPVDAKDMKGSMLDDTNIPKRVRLELTSAGVKINGNYVACIGDKITVTVPDAGGVCIGVITSGASK